MSQKKIDYEELVVKAALMLQTIKKEMTN